MKKQFTRKFTCKIVEMRANKGRGVAGDIYNKMLNGGKNLKCYQSWLEMPAM